MALDLLKLVFNHKRRLDGARDDESLPNLVRTKKFGTDKMKKLIKMGMDLQKK